MDKKALLDYALYARKELETQIGLSLNKLGIYKDHITKANIVGDYTIIEGNPEPFPKRVFDLRKTIIGTYFKDEKFGSVVEEFAYTWFNRIIALRFMEVHEYFSHGFRVLTSRDGSYEPEIITNIQYVIDELHLEKSVVDTLKEQGKSEELYRYVLFKQCNALSSIFPELFTKQDSYLELLLPNNLLSQDSVIRKITMIPEEDFLNDVEVVGWLYQFYNSVKKDEVFASKETITKETLPAVTQLFTPDWIVRYMADNSVGRLWLESYPNSSIKDSLKYYVDDAEQDDETKKRLEEIRYKNVNPEDIKIIEPCCGSGHILVYVFDLLLKMYVENGYNKKDVPSLILKNNLYGLDVDKRAAQLAQFSLIMKARSIDNRFFNEDRFVYPHVYEIKDSLPLIETNYKENMKSLHFSDNSIKQVDYLVETFRYGKVIGSLLKVESKDYSGLIEDIKRCRENETPNLFEADFFNDGIKNLKRLIRLAKVLSKKYDVMITNPPYIGIGTLEEHCRKYANTNYPDSKADMFAMFMDTGFIRLNGFMAIINMHSWMFLDSFQNLREKILSNYQTLSLVHLGIKAFEEIGNDVVQTCTFVMKKVSLTNYSSVFIRLVDCKDYQMKQIAFFSSEYHYICFPNKFLKVPGFLFTPYYVGDDFLNNFSKGKYIESYANFTGSQNITGDNDRFLRYFWEIESQKITKDYWVTYAKGGNYRKYYGNLQLVIDWRKEARKYYQDNKTSNLLDSKYWYKEGITYSAVTSRGTGFRYLPEGCVFDKGGPSIIVNSRLYELLALLNSKVAEFYFKILNPSINLQVKDIKSFPLIFSDDEMIEKRAIENVDLAKKDYDDCETSLGYSSPFLKYQSKNRIDSIIEGIIKEESLALKRIQSNEVEINEAINKLYKINVPLKFENRDFPITLKTKDALAVELISFLIGLLMGRYSLEQEGLVYAGGAFDKSKYGDYVDDDGVLPIYQFIGIDNGLTSSICKLVKRIYGDTYYRENLDFIAEALDRKPEEGAEDTINRYLNDSFYNDHLKTYQKRPIYWMLSSGKQGAFKCLVYLHRYNKNTLALINTKYFLPRTAMYKSERERLTDQLSRADIREKKKIEQQLAKVEACEEELLEYGQVLDHMANQYIDIDLDDGVKVNYCKFQGISLEVNGATVKKNLLVPFGLEEKK